MIGTNSTILPGVTIGNKAVVAAGTVVHKDVAPGTFVAGNPMRIIFTNEEMIERNQKDMFLSKGK
ncbi:bacterial transferase hexapeptide domain protein [Gracilibacillus boraciitolerans JCM 21714]|uniref:Bacterial transferase hexapeptide domain protein n=1 Tax=Gracilibacillus boraciitolerans JCM 21714 TaxID=1298598 RepID=W4VH75_9BACI|nr:bacterial transferase hexapeptide domain protein [Gracilibacillus boraciitolerans JCM 21714]